MTVLHFKSKGSIPPVMCGATTPHVFSSVDEARIALASDNLGQVFISKEEVYVSTIFGAGKFGRRMWEQGQ